MLKTYPLELPVALLPNNAVRLVLKLSPPPKTAPVGVGWGLLSAWVESVASPGNSDNLSVVEQAIENGAGGGHIAQQLAPFFYGALEVIIVERLL